MGVSVRETTAESTMVTAQRDGKFTEEAANHVPMKSSGMRTAMSETVREMMVKPICSAALHGGLHRRVAGLDVARDVFDHDDRVIHHKAGGDGKAMRERLSRL